MVLHFCQIKKELIQNYSSKTQQWVFHLFQEQMSQFMSVHSMDRVIAIHPETMEIECRYVRWVLRQLFATEYTHKMLIPRFSDNDTNLIPNLFVLFVVFSKVVCCVSCMGGFHHTVGVQYPQYVFISAPGEGLCHHRVKSSQQWFQ